MTSAVSQPADAQATPRPARTNLLARNEVRLFLTSLAILFVELLLIRWIPANVNYIGFFSNFLLIASFLGIGLGILLGRNGCNPRLSPFAFLLARSSSRSSIASSSTSRSTRRTSSSSGSPRAAPPTRTS